MIIIRMVIVLQSFDETGFALLPLTFRASCDNIFMKSSYEKYQYQFDFKVEYDAVEQGRWLSVRPVTVTFYILFPYTFCIYLHLPETVIHFTSIFAGTFYIYCHHP